MPDHRRIRRFGPGPQSFTRGQHQQQKPVGSCLTFQQPLNGTADEPQQLQYEPHRHRYTASEPQQLQYEPHCHRYTAGEPQ